MCQTCSSGLPNRMRNWIHGVLPSYVPHLYLPYLMRWGHIWRLINWLNQGDVCIIQTQKVIKLQKQTESLIVLTTVVAAEVFIPAKMVALCGVT